MSIDERFFNWSEFAHYSEREYFQYLKENLPNGFHVIHSKFIESKEIHYEIDFVVLCPNRIYLVEQKCWGNKVIGNDAQWEVYYDNNPEIRIEKSPYEIIQKKQRILHGFIRKKYGGKRIPTVTSIIVLGSPPSRIIQRELSGNCASITYSPEESLELFLKHNRFPNKREETSSKKNSRALFDLLKRNLEPLKRIEVSKIVLSEQPVWNLELVIEEDSVKILEETGEISDRNKITFDVISPSLKTKSYFEAIDYLKEAIDRLINTSYEQHEQFITGIQKIAQSWYDAVRNGKVLPGLGYVPLLKIKNREDVYRYLSGGLVRNDIDYHSSFKEFRDRKLKPRNNRDTFIIIEGRIGSGKTTELCRIAYEAITEGKQIYVINPEISIPKNINIKESYLIVDNFGRMHPENIQTLYNYAVKGKNIIYGALRRELKEIIIQRYEDYFERAKIPWRSVELPEWDYEKQIDVFMKLREDWKCYVVEESMASILQFGFGNPALLSEPLKFPNRFRGSPSKIESLMNISTSGFGIPSIYIKHMRLISDFVELKTKNYDKTLKTIYIYTFLNDYFPEFVWDILAKELNLYGLNHEIMQAIRVKNFSQRHAYFEKWKSFFNLWKLVPEELLRNISQPGENEKFKKVLSSLNIEKWNNEIRDVGRKLHQSNSKSLEKLNTIEKIVLCYSNHINIKELRNINASDILIDSSKLAESVIEAEYAIPTLILILTSLLQRGDEQEILVNLVEELLQSVSVFHSFIFAEILTLSLRNLVEWYGFNKKGVNKKFQDMFFDFLPLFKEYLEEEKFLKNNAENYPVEIFRAAIWLDKKLASEIKEISTKNRVFGKYIEGLMSYYALKREILSQEEKKIELCRILLNWLWDLSVTSEEFDSYLTLIELFETEGKLVEALSICLNSIDISMKGSPDFTEIFLDKAVEITRKTKNKVLEGSITKMKSVISMIQPRFLFEEFAEFNEVLEIHEAIQSFIKKNQINAAKKLFTSKREIIKKHDKELFSNYNILFEEEKDEKVADLTEIGRQIDLLSKQERYDEIIRITNNLPEFSILAMDKSALIILRERAKALGKLGHFDDALINFIQALSISYLDPMGEYLRKFIIGQIAITLHLQGDTLSSLFLILTTARNYFPHLFIRRKTEIDHLPNLEGFNQLEKKKEIPFSFKSLNLYDTTNLLVEWLAGSQFSDYAERLAEISLNDSELDENIRGQCFSLIALSRIAEMRGDKDKEEEIFKRALTLSSKINDLDIQNALRARKQPFPDIFNKSSNKPKEQKIIEINPIQNYINELSIHVKQNLVSQYVFESGFEILKMLPSSDSGEDDYVLIYVGLYSVMPKYLFNIKKLAVAIRNLEFELFSEQYRETLEILCWDLITDLTILEEEEENVKLLGKISNLKNKETRSGKLTLIVLYLLDNISNLSEKINFQWTSEGLSVNLYGEIIVIGIEFIKTNCQLIIERILISNEDLIFTKLKKLEKLFPEPEVLCKIIQSLKNLNLLSSARRVFDEALSKYPEIGKLRNCKIKD